MSLSPPFVVRWWRLLEPYRFKECPDHIIVRGAERMQPSRMGSFGKIAVSVDMRPVYKNEYDQFMVKELHPTPTPPTVGSPPQLTPCCGE